MLNLFFIVGFTTIYRLHVKWNYWILVTKHEIIVTKDEINVTTDEISVTKHGILVTKDEIIVTKDEISVTKHGIGVTKLEIIIIKGSDRLCKVVELSMQCCGKLLSDSFETYKTFYRSVIPEFECKFDVQNSYFGGGYVYRISFLNY